jgi:hypothetical protein
MYVPLGFFVFCHAARHKAGAQAPSYRRNFGTAITMKSLSVLRGTQSDFFAKVMPQRGRRPEAAALRDVINGKPGRFLIRSSSAARDPRR